MLLYGCETWVNYRCHLNTLHQRCFRKMFRIQWEDRNTNASVLTETNIDHEPPPLDATGCVRMPVLRLPDKSSSHSCAMVKEPAAARIIASGHTEESSPFTGASWAASYGNTRGLVRNSHWCMPTRTGICQPNCTWLEPTVRNRYACSHSGNFDM